MAFDYGFGPGPVIDPDTGDLVTSATGQVYAAATGGDALTVRQGALTTTNVQAGTDGMVQQFFADVPRVFVEFPGVSRFELVSYLDLIAQSQEARDAAVAAQDAAESAEDIVRDLIDNGGGGGGGGFIDGVLTEGDPYPGPGIYLIRPASEIGEASMVGGWAVQGFGDATGTLPGSLQDGDIGLAAISYNAPSGTNLVVPSGWSILVDQQVGSTVHVTVMRKTLTAAESGTDVVSGVDSGSQKMAFTGIVIRGATIVNNSTYGSTDDNPTVNVGAPSVVVSFWGQRTSTPATSISAPSGMTLLDSVFNTGGGSGSGAVAYSLTPATGTVGGGTWNPDISNAVTATCTVALKVAPA